MADGTKIEWACHPVTGLGATWNVITGCSHASPGCKNCYAQSTAGKRLKSHPSRAGLTMPSKAGPVWTGEVRFNEQWLLQPLHWREPRGIFVCAHGDLFHEDVPDDWIERVFAVMALCPQHVFFVLTKRAARMRKFFSGIDNGDGWIEGDYLRDAMIEGQAQKLYAEQNPKGCDPSLWLAVHMPLPNVWLGVSVEDQARADERIPELLQTPAAVRWISAEPLLGPIDLTSLCPGTHFVDALDGLRYHDAPEGVLSGLEKCPRLDWVVAGGESGHHARPMHPEWARTLRDQCARASVPFHFKQWGEFTPGENIERSIGTIQTAKWFDHRWIAGREDLARDDGHVDDQPDLYRIGKKLAGRRLDGVEHDAMPRGGT